MRLLTSATARCYCSLLLHLCYCSLLLLLLPAASINRDRLPPRCTHSITPSPHHLQEPSPRRAKATAAHPTPPPPPTPPRPTPRGKALRGKARVGRFRLGPPAAAKGPLPRARVAGRLLRPRGVAVRAQRRTLRPHASSLTIHHVPITTSDHLPPTKSSPARVSPQSHTTKSLFFFD